ncbi:hypothetical protein DPMN_097498 [Dreissena polymorpha]|uniref:M-phase inducer phosphatase n=1 Tax=Dreissena polymorpha TaxID=45954 RepID=A0A9D4R5G3_DREPO|nr:hypothetical protein DPMN_097498 [Dreissena polymorpha]
MGLDDLLMPSGFGAPIDDNVDVSAGKYFNADTPIGKRPIDDADLHNQRKRRRSQSCELTSDDTNDVRNTTSISTIIKAVERLSTEPRLVADGSRENVLTSTVGKHNDLNAITSQTMSDVLNGVYRNQIDHLTIVDCRYPYEYDGGHIKGTINLYTKQAIKEFLDNTVTSPDKNHVIIFHCEFSTERGPKLYRHLRSLDRELNAELYPRLKFPEMYLLEGGYKEFFQTHKEHCFPQSYMPMLHKKHSEDLRHFRVKSKSWAAGDKPRQESRVNGSGTRLCF